MKVCITASGPQMSDPSDPRFGRCSYFVFLDLATKSVEAVANPNLEAAGGAGIRSAELVASREVAAVITGHVGPEILPLSRPRQGVFKVNFLKAPPFSLSSDKISYSC